MGLYPFRGLSKKQKRLIFQGVLNIDMPGSISTKCYRHRSLISLNAFLREAAKMREYG